MKTAKIMAALIALVLGLALSTAPLAEDDYGALRLEEEKTYQLREVVRAMLEETGLRLQWLSQAAERFPDEPLFTQALEMEQARAQAMLQQFAAWGFSEQTIQPPDPPEVPAGHEQALYMLRSMAQLGMLMSMRLEENREVPDEDRFQAHMWGHEYRQQLDDCDLKANEYGYAWAWQYEGEETQQEQDQEQNQENNGPQEDAEPAQEQDREQNQENNGPQEDAEPAQEQDREQNQEQDGVAGNVQGEPGTDQEQNQQQDDSACQDRQNQQGDSAGGNGAGGK